MCLGMGWRVPASRSRRPFLRLRGAGIAPDPMREITSKTKSELNTDPNPDSGSEDAPKSRVGNQSVFPDRGV